MGGGVFLPEESYGSLFGSPASNGTVPEVLLGVTWEIHFLR